MAPHDAKTEDVVNISKVESMSANASEFTEERTARKVTDYRSSKEGFVVGSS